MAEPSVIIPWKDGGKGRVFLFHGGRLEADSSNQLSKGLYISYIPNGERFRIGYKDGNGVFKPLSAQYRSVASSGNRSLCKVRMRLRPNITTVAGGVDPAPTKIVGNDPTYITGRGWFTHNTKFTPAIKIENDVFDLSDETTSVAVGPGQKCIIEFAIKLLADKKIPPEPILGPSEND